ncbi:MAG TPA: insecticidal delta-endotoxin Cry8Ea1 family protein [Pyrinomonadaceae bacterium]|jgi:hypothetical protein
MSFDWNNAAENALAGGFGMVPEVGSILGALVYIFWPHSGENVWAEIEKQVEQLIDEKIDELVYQQVTDDLSGLNNVLNDYLSAVQTGDLANISEQWIIASSLFDEQLPHFQSSGYEILLLPLFAQFVNLNLSLLRDGVLFGAGWGWNQAYQQSVSTKLTNNISAFTQYSNKYYQQGQQDMAKKTKKNYHKCEPFRSVNTYVRQMTLGVLDFIQLWPYFDPTKYPDPVSVYLDREIYSDPVGTCDDSGAIKLPSPPTQPISQITVWAWDRIDAVQVAYPAGGGPGGVTKTARMGDKSGGSNQPPHGGVFKVSNNPVTVAAGLSGDILNALTFTFKDGTNTGKLGGNYPGGGHFSFSYTGEILSSIHINGVSQYYGSADCAVFGFKYEQSQNANLDAMGLLYITSPAADATLADLATRSVTRQVPLDELTAKAAAEGWDTQRQEYWRHLKSRSKNKSKQRRP